MGKDLATKYWHEIRKLEKLLGEALRKIKRLEEQVVELKRENMELRIENADLSERLFGKRKKNNNDTDGDDGFVSLRKKEKESSKRNAKSYRRMKPQESEITERKEYLAECCLACGLKLTQKKVLERWVEDIPPFFEKPQKTVTYELIHSGYCKRCRKRSYGKEMNLQGQQVRVGDNVKSLILYCIYIQNMSWQSTIDLVVDLYGLSLSDGEITNVLKEGAEKLEDEHVNIRKTIRGSPASHMDETSWRMKALQYYGWIWVPKEGKEVSMEVRNTRGKGVAKDIVGDTYKGVLSTDFYSAYDDLVENHGTCWVHLIRDFENLAKNKNIPKTLQKHCYKRYGQICQLYQELCVELEKSFCAEERICIHKRFQGKLLRWAKISSHDTKLKKLRNLKLRIQKYLDELTIPLLHPDVSPHNNKAEQAIRHLVIKRKISHGSRSDDGCKILSINLSVLLTYWRSHRLSFFQKLNSLLLPQS